MQSFTAEIAIIGVNPYVSVPEAVLAVIFEHAGKHKGKVPIQGTVNGKPYRQTLVRYAGHWRLYINTTMLKHSPRRIGERIEVTIAYDAADRSIAPHPKWVAALQADPQARAVFESLRPSLQLEIVRYIARLKSEESVDRNVVRAIDFLMGRGRFVGRDRP